MNTTRALLLLVLASGCNFTRPEVPKPECEVDSECTEGKICGPGGRCTAACKADADCSAPRTCLAGACVLPTGSCERDGDCAATALCGLGSRCLPRCASATDCGVNEACVGGACTSVSSGACRFNSECPAAQACVQGRCAESCLEDRDCSFGTTCQSSVCAPRAPECIVSADCATGRACSPQGACVTACTADANCAATGEACSAGACVRVGPDTAGLFGSVVLTGITDRSGLTITATGANRVSSVTAADGTYRFQGLVPGLYTVTASAAGTVEGSKSVESPARAGTTTAAPTLTMTPAGSLSGRVTLAGRTAYEGTQVVLLGTGRGTVTAPDGTFAFTNVPIGTYDLLVAYAGYQAAQATAQVVTYSMNTSVPALTLQPAPTGATFAFSSIPPPTTRVNQPFVFQALAGGGGVAAVTYAVVDAPDDFTINPNTGQVTWTPTFVDTHYITLSASGGGATVFQLFRVDVTLGAVTLHESYVDRVLATDAGAWTVNDLTAHFVSPDGGVRQVGQRQALTGAIGSIEHLNGRTVTALRTPGGTLSGADMPVGTLGATWEGGVAGAVTGVNSYSVASNTLLGGTSGTATVATPDTVTSGTFPSGTITSLDDGRAAPTAFRANTGLISAVSSTGITDSQGTWGTDQFVTLCVKTASGKGNLRITANTATGFTLESDPSAVLTPGDRYFVVSCGSANTTYTIVDSARLALPVMTGRYLDVYSATASVGWWAITGSTAPPNATFSFSAPMTVYQQLLDASLTGTYALTVNSGASDLLVTDATAPWGAVTTANSRFFFPDGPNSYPLGAASASVLTVRVSNGSLLTFDAGRGWALSNAANQVAVTLTAAIGGWTPGALVNRFFWVDGLGTSVTVTANTANTITFSRGANLFPLALTPGALLVPTTQLNVLPELVVPTAGLQAGAHVGRNLVRLNLASASVPFLPSTTYLIARNTSTSVTIAEEWCSWCARGTLAQRLTELSGRRWAPGTASPSRVDYRLVVSGTPNFAPQALVGRTVVLERNLNTTAIILENDASSLVLAVDQSDFAEYQAVAAGARFWLSESVTSVGTLPLHRVRITSPGSAWTPTQFVGASVISDTSQYVGNVESNTDDELVLITNNNLIALVGTLSPGEPFAFGVVRPEAPNCNSPYASIRTTFTLPGATLVAGAYNRVSSVTSVYSSFPLFSSTTSGGTGFLCFTSFRGLLDAIGQRAAFDTDGNLSFTVRDGSASYAAGALVGKFVYLLGPGAGRINAGITANTATTITLGPTSSYSWMRSGQFDSVVPAVPYVITDASNLTETTVTVSPALTPGSLDGRTVWLSQNSSSTTHDYLHVTANTANEVTLRGLSANNMIGWSPGLRWRYLGLSRGVTVRVTIAAGSAPLQPGELVGRNLVLSSVWMVITANTANTITASVDPESRFPDVLYGDTWTVDRGTWREGETLPGGELLLVERPGSTAWRVGRLTPGGAVSFLTPMSGQAPLTLTPAPNLVGTLETDPLESVYSTAYTDSRWAFAHNELVGAYLRVTECSSTLWHRIIGNTATTITTRDLIPCNSVAAGSRYVIDRARVQVSGATLTAGALVGKALWVNGREYRIRANGASSIDLVLPDQSPNSSFYESADPAEAGALGFVISGVSWNTTLAGVAPDGAGSLWVAGTNGQLARWSGTAWVDRQSEFSSAPVLATGTVTTTPFEGGIIDSAKSFAPNAFMGKRLVVNGRSFAISTNTATQLTMSGAWGHDGPEPGDGYVVTDTDPLGGYQDLTSAGSTLWVGASSGLLRLAGTTWTRWTVASTQSASWLRDGLAADDVERVRVLPSGDVWALTSFEGASRLRGSSWLQVTRLNTQSMPGLGDGLPGDRVWDVVEHSGSTWFSTSGGAARWTGTAWSPVGKEQGFTSNVYGVWHAPNGEVHLGDDSGFYRLLP